MNSHFMNQMALFLPEEQVGGRALLGINKRALWAEGRCYCFFPSWAAEFDILKSGNSINLSWRDLSSGEARRARERIWSSYLYQFPEVGPVQTSGFIYLNRKTGKVIISSSHFEFSGVVGIPGTRKWIPHFQGPWPPSPSDLPQQARAGLSFIKQT